MKTTKECPACGAEFTRIHAVYRVPTYCSRSCANKAPGRMTEDIRAKISAGTRVERNPNWAGGQWTSNEGRIFVRVPVAERHLHPTIRRDGYIQRYQYVWNTAHPEDPVREGDVIHHINEDPSDDRLENLEKTTQSTHARKHGLGRRHTQESRERMRLAQRARRQRERGHGQAPYTK